MWPHKESVSKVIYKDPVKNDCDGLESLKQKIPIARFYCADKVPPKSEPQSLSGARKRRTAYLCNDPKSIEVSLDGQKK